MYWDKNTRKIQMCLFNVNIVNKAIYIEKYYFFKYLQKIYNYEFMVWKTIQEAKPLIKKVRIIEKSNIKNRLGKEKYKINKEKIVKEKK